MKKIFSIILISTAILCSGYKTNDKFIIDATTNAAMHNMIGTQYVTERDYYSALQEFKIAVSLNPNTQSSAVYYNNLGEVYMKLGFAGMARDCYERAIKLYGLNFDYYNNLAICYGKLRLSGLKIAQLRRSKNPLDKVLLGLLYIHSGNKLKGIMTLDDFCMSEPDLIITQGVKNYLRDLTKKK